MPALQVVDLSPIPRTTQTPLEQTLASFTDRFRENRENQKESDALKRIYQQYQQDGQDINNAYAALQSDPTLSPTQRVNATNSLLNLAKTNASLQTEAAKKVKAEQQTRDAAEKKQQEVEAENEKKRLQQEQISYLEEKRGLEKGDLAAFANDPAMAERITKPKPLGKPTQASQPIDPEQLANIEAVVSQPGFKQLSAPDQKLALLRGNVSKENADAVVSPGIEERKLQKQQEEIDRQQRNLHHKEWAKYDDQIASNATGAKHQLDSIEDTTKAIASGKIKPTSLANIFRKLGKGGEAIAEALLSKEEATLLASIPAFLEGRKELFGVRLSDADLALLRDKLPDIGKSKEANMAILKLMKRSADKAILKENIARDIKKQNGGLRPVDYRDQVEERFDALVKDVEVIDPKTKRKIQVPTYKLAAALKKGAKLANE